MRARKDETAKTAKDFMKKEVVHPFGPPRVVVSDNDGFFTARRFGQVYGRE